MQHCPCQKTEGSHDNSGVFCHYSPATMEPRDDFFEDLLRAIDKLPAQQRSDALGAYFSDALKMMDRKSISKMRAQIEARLATDFRHRSVLDLIDGHLALRDIGRTP